MTLVVEPGTLIDERFEILEFVEQGGMGAVYKAFDRSENQQVALKFMRNDVAVEPIVAARFEREASLLAELDHPRVVRYVAHGRTADGHLYLAMQWLDGHSLRTLLTRGPLSLSDSLVVLRAVAEALSVAHARGVVHRDLKPGNLFLREGRISELTLLDFGIARRFEGAATLTATGALLGTPDYMSPEQARGDGQGQPTSDIFSLGSIFYECLAGRRPFDADNVTGVLVRILYETPEPVRRRRPSIPEAWAAVLSRMLSKDPARRPEDASALLHEIAHLPPAGLSPDTLTGEPLSIIPPAGESEEQVWICVVLATLEAEGRRPPEAGAGERPGDHFRASREALSRSGLELMMLADGTVIGTVSSSGAATDQVRLAARCALKMRELWPESRVAVASGRVFMRKAACIGEAVDRATQILDRLRRDGAAATGSIGLDAVTFRLLEDRYKVEPFHEGGVLLGELAGVDESRRLLGKPTPCVGRDPELAQIDALLARCIDEGVPHAVIVIAPAGVGKSRLRNEARRRLRDKHPDAEILTAFGEPLSAGSPYGMLAGALLRHAGIGPTTDPARARQMVVERLCGRVETAHKKRVSEFLGELCGVPFSAESSPPLKAARSEPLAMSEQITHAFLDWLTAECAAHPIVLMLEDMHWGDALTVKLLEAVFAEIKDAPLFVLALGRPELTESFPGFLSAHAQSIALQPLSRRASEQLVRSALGEDVVSPETLRRITQLAAGNALFLEELIRAAAEGRAADVPETVLAILQARVTRLDPDSRRVLRAASVIGETFWVGAVEQLCEGSLVGSSASERLSLLTAAELVERRRQSRFPGEIEYSFRHALLRDAAYGLLVPADRSAGHLAALQWLLAAGETDVVALAGHAREGGDMERAVELYTSAAAQSLAQNDLAEALARSAKGVECGARGEALGALRGIQAVTSYGLGSWAQVAAAGVEALELLPRGSAWWCRTAEKLLQVLPQVNEVGRFELLVREVEEVEPAPEARSDYVCMLSFLLMGALLVGPRERGRRYSSLIERAAGGVDLHVRGVTRFTVGAYTHFIEPNPGLAVSALRGSAEDFTSVQILHRLALAQTCLGSALLDVGEAAAGEDVTRRSLAVAEQIRDAYLTMNAQCYLSWLLSESGDPAKAEEADELAQLTLKAPTGPVYEGCGYVALGRAALARGNPARAEEALRAARGLLLGIPPMIVMCSGHLITALLRQGRAARASEVAGELLGRLRQEGVGFTEIPARVAAVEALAQNGQGEEARSLLRETLREIELRAAIIPDAAVRDAYLLRNASNRRASELAEELSVAPLSAPRDG